MKTIQTQSWLLLAAMLAGFILTNHSANAQTWTLTSAPSNNWTSVACSADGSVIVAASTNEIDVSTNAGATWQYRNVYDYLGWTSVAASSDGKHLVAALPFYQAYSPYYPPPSNLVFLSTNTGRSWFASGPPTNLYWYAVAASSDGGKLLAAAITWSNYNVYRSGSLFYSPDGGVLWSNCFPNLVSSSWTAATISSNGNVMAAVSSIGTNEYVFVSTNAAVSWFSNCFSTSLTQLQSSLACSADGSKLVLAASGNSIYISTNFGVNWSQTATPRPLWSHVVCSADGSRIIAVSNDGLVFGSVNGGATWNSLTNPYQYWVGIAASADASKLVMVSANPVSWSWHKYGYVFTYSAPATQVLNIALSGGNASLTWPWPSSDVVLQRSPSLASPNWTTLTNVPAVVNQLILPATNSSNFYRLATP
jgi:photosystem II stability/assembly factor-like uncharacterized protein